MKDFTFKARTRSCNFTITAEAASVVEALGVVLRWLEGVEEPDCGPVTIPRPVRGLGVSVVRVRP